MVLLEAYRPRAMSVSNSPYKIGNGGVEELQARLYADLSRGGIRDLNIDSPGVVIRGSKRALDYPVLEVACGIPEKQRDNFAAKLAAKAVDTEVIERNWDHKSFGATLPWETQRSNLWFGRILGENFWYAVDYNPKTKVLRVRLQPEVLERAADRRAGGYQYGLEGKKEREKLFDEVIKPVEADVRAHGFSPRITRYNTECMTAACFEPKPVDKKQLAKFIRTLMEEGSSEVYYTYEYFYDKAAKPDIREKWKVVVTPKGLTASITGNRSSTIPILDGGLVEVSGDALISYQEAYTTALGRVVERGVGATSGFLKHLRDYKSRVPKIVKETVFARRLEREQKIGSWLEEHAPKQNIEYKDGCIILVDPVCEVRAAVGENPPVKVEI